MATILPRSDDAFARETTDPRAELDGLAERMDPRRNRDLVLAQLAELFRSGTPPHPLPEGPLTGRLLATSTWPAWDTVAMRLARWWMPWLGKAFDPRSMAGYNRFAPTPAARLALTSMFPSYRPEFVGPGEIRAFPFANRLGPGELDPGVCVLRIEYDAAPNPAFVRRVLDELVEIAPGCYLGQALLRLGDRYRRAAFFSLQAAP